MVKLYKLALILTIDILEDLVYKHIVPILMLTDPNSRLVCYYYYTLQIFLVLLWNQNITFRVSSDGINYKWGESFSI